MAKSEIGQSELLEARAAVDYVANVGPAKLQRDLHDVVQNIQNLDGEGLIPIYEGSGDAIILVQGIDSKDFPTALVEPMSHLIESKKASYYFGWNKMNSVRTSRDQLIDAIRFLLEDDPKRNITIVGFSAGGLIALLALDDLVNDPIYPQLFVHTLAAPIFGYDILPIMSYTVSPFIGLGTAQIGVGVDKLLKHRHLEQCDAWITTNGSLDIHARARGGIYPETGPEKSHLAMPCGDDKVTKVDDSSHNGLVKKAFDELHLY